MAGATYHLLGRACTREEYEAFRARLEVSERFIDERYPAGGFGAIRDARDPATGKRYVVNEYQAGGVSGNRIDPA